MLIAHKSQFVHLSKNGRIDFSRGSLAAQFRQPDSYRAGFFWGETHATTTHRAGVTTSCVNRQLAFDMTNTLLQCNNWYTSMLSQCYVERNLVSNGGLLGEVIWQIQETASQADFAFLQVIAWLVGLCTVLSQLHFSANFNRLSGIATGLPNLHSILLNY